jgi:hypothetical protein
MDTFPFPAPREQRQLMSGLVGEFFIPKVESVDASQHDMRKNSDGGHMLGSPGLYDEDYMPNSPTFFADAYAKIRSLSSELYQCAGETLARGYAVDPPKVEFLAQELLKVARQINNTTDDDDKKSRLPPPLVRPRRIRRKHNEEEECDDASGQKKIGVAPELYCHSCGTTDTPEWRRGPDGCKSLCNACGLHYAKILRRETMIPNRQPARTTMTLNNLLN